MGVCPRLQYTLGTGRPCWEVPESFSVNQCPKLELCVEVGYVAGFVVLSTFIYLEFFIIKIVIVFLFCMLPWWLRW